MRTPVEVQIWSLSVLFLAGTAVNVLFQTYTAFRGVFRPRRFGRHFLDIIFSLAVLGTAAAVIFLVNWGELRLYVAISLLLGFWFSNYLVGELVYAIAYRGFKLGKKGGRWTKTRVIAPSGRFIVRTGSKAKSWLFPPTPPDEDVNDSKPPDDENGDGNPPNGEEVGPNCPGPRDDEPRDDRPPDDKPHDGGPQGD